MVYQLSEDEQREAQAIEANYVRLLKECEEQARELRPDDNPNSYESFEAYLAAGSKEWKATRRRSVELFQQYNTTINDYLNNRFDEHFRRIADDPEAIVKDAFDEIKAYIPRTYNFFISEYGSEFVNDAVRATDDGFLLDSNKIIIGITDLLAQRHTKHLQKADIDRINEYIVKVIAESPYTSSEDGELLGKVTKKPRPVKIETTEETGLKTTLLANKTVLITRIMEIIFDGKRTLEMDYEKDLYDDKNRYAVGLFSKDCPYKIRIAIDYRAVEDTELLKLPALSRIGKQIYNILCSYWLQGIYVITFRQLWRAVCGAMKRNVKYGDAERKTIELALLSFKATVAFSTGQIVELAKTNGDKAVMNVKEAGGAFQILHYDITYEKVNGQLTQTIRLEPGRRPILLEIAQVLNNQYMTDNIEFFDVRGLENNIENFELKDYLFIRIKQMKNPHNSLKSKRISLDALIKTLGITPIDKKVAADRSRKSKLVGRIEKILDNAVDINFISGYTANKRKGSTEVISFSIEPYKKRNA